MPDDLHWLPGWRIRDLIVRQEISAVEVAAYFLSRIAEADPHLHAFVTVAADAALEQARAVDRAVRRGQANGLLFGVPVSMKDLPSTAVQGLRNSAGSLLYQDRIAAQDSVHAERIRAAGGIILGMTSTPEFGLAARTVSRLMPECLNPWDRQRTAGGSSGGAAAGVAAGLGPLAVGTDAGGSIRIPAAFCGVFGLAPSSGRVPRQGATGGTLQFASAGPLARDVRDAALLLQVLAGPDKRDPTCRDDQPPDYLAGLEDGVEGLRVGWMRDFGDVLELDPEVVAVARDAAECLRAHGARLTPCRQAWPHSRQTMAAINAAHAYALEGQVLHEDPAAWGQLTPYARERFESGRRVTGAEYVLALKAHFELMEQVDSLFDDYDLIASPTVGFVAPRLAELEGMRMPPATAAITETANFVGYAAASIPAGFLNGLPVGLHLIARPNEEALLLRAARVIEQAQPWMGTRPSIQ